MVSRSTAMVEVRAGEIVGLAGDNNGQRELPMQTLY